MESKNRPPDFPNPQLLIVSRFRVHRYYVGTVRGKRFAPVDHLLVWKVLDGDRQLSLSLPAVLSAARVSSSAKSYRPMEFSHCRSGVCELCVRRNSTAATEFSPARFWDVRPRHTGITDATGAARAAKRINSTASHAAIFPGNIFSLAADMTDSLPMMRQVVRMAMNWTVGRMMRSRLPACRWAHDPPTALWLVASCPAEPTPSPAAPDAPGSESL